MPMFQQMLLLSVQNVMNNFIPSTDCNSFLTDLVIRHTHTLLLKIRMKTTSRRLPPKHLRLSRYSSYLFMIFWQTLDICIIISDSTSSFQEDQNNYFTNPGNTTIFLFWSDYAPNIDPSYSANIKCCARVTNYPSRCPSWLWCFNITTRIFFYTNHWWSFMNSGKISHHFQKFGKKSSN